jgi:small redox-active disulfide protein 2
MLIKVLGAGCTNCRNLEKAARQAVDELGVEAEFDHVTDPGEIASYGVMRTPGLVVDEQVVVSGRVPNVAEVKRLLTSSVG